MSKSPGFWFFTGDWLKDPELRFCSIFARGLLVDLLCFCFESARQGYLSKPDGTARTDEEIVSAISGGTIEEKLQALKELESSGVLSRDENGVLFSRRIARLADLSTKRSNAGSKGGSKTQAKVKQNTNQNTNQNRGVSVSDSVSVSDITHTHTGGGIAKEKVDPKLLPHWEKWCSWLETITGRKVDPIRAETMLMDMERRGIEKSIRDIDFSILKDAKALLDSENDFQKQMASPRQNGPPKKPKKTVHEMMEEIYGPRDQWDKEDEQK